MAQLKYVYFIGIGGIGMSAIARYFLEQGVRVAGYDRTKTDLTNELESEGANIHYSASEAHVSDRPDLVIYTPAVPEDHVELQYCIKNNIPLVKRAKALGEIVNSGFTIAVAGSHGKTTVCSMIAHLLHEAGCLKSAFLGGIAVNYSSNYISGDGHVSVVEADEYDRSFLQLNPDVIVVTAVDSDHLDVYQNEAEIKRAFEQFLVGSKAESTHIIHRDANVSVAHGKEIRYAISDSSTDAHAKSVEIKDGSYHCEFQLYDQLVMSTQIKVGGKHNIENAIAAIQACIGAGVSTEILSSAISTFKGVRRRFELRCETSTQIHIDDYAHHPAEIEALLQGVRELYPKQSVTAIFQPHLFSRTRDLADGFARALDKTEKTYLLPIYPAREMPIEGVTSEIILDRMSKENNQLITASDISESRLEWDTPIVLTIGAGDIDQLVPMVTEQVQKGGAHG